MRGYQAYADGKPVCWRQAAPRLLIPNLQLDGSLAVDNLNRAGAAVCFTIAAPYRRRGIAGALLEAACAGSRAQGLAIAEAYMRTNASDDAHNYHGPLALYLQAGFTVFGECVGCVMVRKDLTSSSDGWRRQTRQSIPH
jgi:GNAT superfamily N-acetyltransferase